MFWTHHASFLRVCTPMRLLLKANTSYLLNLCHKKAEVDAHRLEKPITPSFFSAKTLSGRWFKHNWVATATAKNAWGVDLKQWIWHMAQGPIFCCDLRDYRNCGWKTLETPSASWHVIVSGEPSKAPNVMSCFLSVVYQVVAKIASSQDAHSCNASNKYIQIPKLV